MLVKRWEFDDKFVNVIAHHEDAEFSEDASPEILAVHLANMLNRTLGFSLFEDEVNYAGLQSAQILKIAPETIDSIGEQPMQIPKDAAHLF